jgi:hypothetical protein
MKNVVQNDCKWGTLTVSCWRPCRNWNLLRALSRWRSVEITLALNSSALRARVAQVRSLHTNHLQPDAIHESLSVLPPAKQKTITSTCILCNAATCCCHHLVHLITLEVQALRWNCTSSIIRSIRWPQQQAALKHMYMHTKKSLLSRSYMLFSRHNALYSSQSYTSSLPYSPSVALVPSSISPGTPIPSGLPKHSLRFITIFTTKFNLFNPI